MRFGDFAMHNMCSQRVYAVQLLFCICALLENVWNTLVHKHSLTYLHIQHSHTYTQMQINSETTGRTGRISAASCTGTSSRSSQQLQHEAPCCVWRAHQHWSAVRPGRLDVIVLFSNDATTVYKMMPWRYLGALGHMSCSGDGS